MAMNVVGPGETSLPLFKYISVVSHCLLNMSVYTDEQSHPQHSPEKQHFKTNRITANADVLKEAGVVSEESALTLTFIPPPL